MKYILLDLDGTITDPKEGITRSVQYALKSKGILIEDLDSLCRHIGPPLKTSFMDFYGFSESEAEELVKKYREYFRDTGIFENKVYEGMDELLRKLRATGKKLITATSKPEVFAKRILEHFGLDHYFDDICGASMDNSRIDKEDVIRYALEKNGIRDLSEVIMVGDREHDVIGAHKVGIASLGVLFGYGSRQELEEAGADRLALTVAEVYDVIMSM